MERWDTRAQFDPTPASIADARRLTEPLRRVLPGPVSECLELVVSELATNAVRHAATPYEVAVRAFPTVRVEVFDTSPDAPVRRHPGPLDPFGRGLLIVEECAERWGVHARPGGGKVIWADVHSFGAMDGSSSPDA